MHRYSAARPRACRLSGTYSCLLLIKSLRCKMCGQTKSLQCSCAPTAVATVAEAEAAALR